jgi:2-amino-4-hydroxy-6-hydroxymethyldihydropteridine diphosphokinase
MATCYIGIGSNLGDRRKNIDDAISLLKGTDAVVVRRVSSIYETDPVSDIPQGKYLNGVIEIETDLRPAALMRSCESVEKSLGRIRTVRNGPRKIDLDILYYGEETIDEPGLKIPHPRIGEREFVLRGLRELGRKGL